MACSDGWGKGEVISVGDEVSGETAVGSDFFCVEEHESKLDMAQTPTQLTIQCLTLCQFLTSNVPSTPYFLESP